MPDPRNDRPVGRGERRAWNTATAVVGGVGALALLLGGAGTAAAVAMTQEREGTWTAASDVQQIRIDAHAAVVNVNTSPTVDRVQVQWYETGLTLEEHDPTPAVRDGVLQMNISRPRTGWDPSVQQIIVTVPENGPRASLDLTSDTGAVHVNGTYRDVRAMTELGSISASDVEAAVIDARAITGQVRLDGVSVKNRLDAHTSQGGALVNVRGTAPQRTSVTATGGVYGISMPAADYWYPQDSQRDFADPRHPVTTSPNDSDASSSERSAASTPSSHSTASATSSTRTNNPAASPSDMGADTVCASAPKDRPCLFVSGSPFSLDEDPYMRDWSEGWDEMTRENESRSTDRGAGADRAVDRATDPATASPSGSATRSPSGGD